jgi:hypothetical protein
MKMWGGADQLLYELAYIAMLYFFVILLCYIAVLYCCVILMCYIAVLYCCVILLCYIAVLYPSLQSQWYHDELTFVC